MSDFATFYCFAGKRPARLTFCFAGTGRIVNPDGTKKIDTGFRSYRANAMGILRIPLNDADAVENIRRQAKAPASGITEDVEVFNEAILTPERKADREKARTAAALAELNSLKEKMRSKAV